MEPGPHPARKPASAHAGAGFDDRLSAPPALAAKPNDRLILPPCHRESIVLSCVARPCPDARCLVTPL
ncbi:hypothetical protein C6P77_04820 [Burkholderia ambifaria]|nr:hypothetical protein C6P77_04820 [Burkholderia ambifaria]